MKVTIRHLVAKPNRGEGFRYYWQPTAKLVRAGWRTERLPDDEGAAIARAKEKNDELDRWYVAGRPRQAEAAPDAAPDGSKPRGSVWQLIDLYKNPPAERPAEDPEADADERKKERQTFGYDYAGLQPKTKRGYDAILDYIASWLGPLPARKVTEAVVLERLKIIANRRHTKGPHAGRRKVATAMAIGRVGRLLFHASRSLVDPAHPCYVKKGENPWAALRARDQRERPVLWTREGRDGMIEAAEAMGLYSIATAIQLNWWLGQREADILALPSTLDLEGGNAHEIVQGKTAASVHLPMGMVPEIVAAVADLRERQKKDKRFGLKLLIDERNSLPWNEDRFRKAFRDVRETAIHVALFAPSNQDPNERADLVEPLTFMRLRHTAVTMLYRAGATIPEIAAITGHTIGSVTQIIERYGARDAITAGNALQKRLNREGE